LRAAALVLIGGGLLLCCARSTMPAGSPAAVRLPPAPADLDAAPTLPDAAEDPSAPDASDEPTIVEDASDAIAASDALSALDATLPDDPMALHHDDAASLRALMGKAGALPLPIEGPWRIGQGNRAISRHAIGQRACLESLRRVVVQTPEQLARCGEANMVPVWDKKAGPDRARFCIDVFEFPNRACELPFVFVSPSEAERICEANGKRLCTQDEWSLSCRGDPAGGPDRVYAYGDELDLGICNTQKPRLAQNPVCDVSTEDKVWTTCGTNTEPSGAFSGCRSRFGVFDLHGNVAEIMTRFEPADGEVKSQLKGSAFFYVDVAKKPTDPGGYWTKYPDDCNFDPRWHVEKLEVAAHVNYHLGFRCCKSLRQGYRGGALVDGGADVASSAAASGAAGVDDAGTGADRSAP
jgi:hypothetical protein